MLPVDEFLAGLQGDVHAAYDHICAITREHVPDAGQKISYGLPTLTYRDKPLLSFLVAKAHLSIFPHSGFVVTQVQEQLPDLPRSKGTIRFSVEQPVADEVLHEIVRLRIAEIDAKLDR